jgi:sugar phosphate permease
MATIDESNLFRKISWHILPLVMLGFFLAYVDRINVGFAKLQMASDLNFSDAVYGFGAGIFFVGYFFFEVPSNLLMHRFGARRWISRIMLTWGVISMLTALVHTALQFYLMRLLLGVAEAGFLPGVIYYMSQWFPAARRARAWSVFYVALAFSGLFGNLLSGLILSIMTGVGGLAGWQWLMVIEGLPTLVLGIFIFFRMADSADKVSWLNDAEKQRLANLLASERAQKNAAHLSDVFCSPRVWTLALIYFTYNAAVYGFTFWLPTLVHAMGVQVPWKIGALSALPHACAIVAMLAFGYSSDRLGDRRWHLVIAFVTAAVGFALSVRWEHDATWGIAALCIANMALLSIPALFWTLPTSLLRDGVVAAAGIAMINSLGNVSGFLAPFMIGYVRDATGSTSGALLAIATLLVLGAVLVLLVTRGCPTEAQGVRNVQRQSGM